MENTNTQYRALKEFEVGPEESHVLYEAGAIFEVSAVLEPELEALLAAGTIEVVAPAEEENVVTQEWLDAHPDSALEVGDAIPTDEAAAKKEEEVEEEKAPEVAQVAAAPTLMYMGKKIINSAPRTVNDITYQQVTLEDHTTHDLTEKDYAEKVSVVK